MKGIEVQCHWDETLEVVSTKVKTWTENQTWVQVLTATL